MVCLHFLNPLETIVGGNVDIEIGSKWVRVSGVMEDTSERFIGQEVSVVTCPPGMPVSIRNEIWIRRKNKDGSWSRPMWVKCSVFIKEFQPLIISLENK